MKRYKAILAGLLVITAGGMAVTFFLVTTIFGQAGDTTDVGQGTSCAATINSPSGVASLDSEQIANAKTITQVGMQLGVPVRGLVIAEATALQESNLRNLTYGDRDSVGLFQQRPSAGWGTVAELTTPEVAASKFYRALLQVSGWQSMPLTEAAQDVQKSAFPLAYAKWETLAQTLVSKMLPGSSPSALTQLASITCGETVGTPLPQGAVGEMLQIALAQQGKPYVWGGIGPDYFDCSGLVVFSWRKAGYRLQVRTSEEMYGVSSRVQPGSEQPGDLLFGDFTSAGPGHVMIVVRPGVAVQAPHTGDVVKVTTYDPTQWAIGRLNASAFLGHALPA